MIKVKERSLSVLIKEADVVFSEFIRVRVAVNGFSRCFICNSPRFWRHQQCGHYINRDHMPTRYDEINGQCVCEVCNCYDRDHAKRFRKALITKYGLLEIEGLEARSYTLEKYMRHELIGVIDYFKEKISNLKK